MDNTAHHSINLYGAVMLGLGSIIGSGWLFGAWQASKMAGPAAILSWIIGALITAVIAYNYIELGAMLPENGGLSKYAQYTHGSLIGFIASWANWISLITIIPIEAVAAVEYMSNWPWAWARWTNGFFSHGGITGSGLLAVYGFVIIFTLLNYWSVDLLVHFTSLISLFKIGIPAITIVALLVSGFHASNFGTSVQQFMPYGSSAVLKATTTAGIIFSLNAFQTIINIGNDLQKSYVNMKRAINISRGISVVIYILLQLVFIGAIDPNMLAKVGWSGIDFSSPFADLATLLGLYWLSVLLYLDAFVSPFGTGVSTVASSGRALAAMVSNDHLPKFIGAINERYHVPRTAMLFNVAVSLVMVTFFRSWGTLATVISSLMLIAYLTGPISVVAFRKMGPEFARPIKIRLVKATSIVAFALVSLAIYWVMWPTTLEVVAIILVGLPIYFVYEWKTGWANTRNQVRGSLWMICYLVVLIALSWVGSRDFNGLGLIPYPLDQLVVVLVSLVFYHWGTNSHLFTKYFQRAKRLNNRKVRIPHRHRVEAAERRHREETSGAAN